MVGTVDATAGSREEALAKLRAEIRYRVELCPCSAVPEGYVELEVRAVSPSPAPGGRRLKLVSLSMGATLASSLLQCVHEAIHPLYAPFFEG